MKGAITGDIIGSRFEFDNINSKHFELLHPHHCVFTDDTILTVAIARAILDRSYDYKSHLHKLANKYPHASYGGNFVRWIKSKDPRPYNSWGNGSGMRVSPVGLAFEDLEDVLLHARLSAEVSHDHPEGIKGAQAIASSIYLARTGSSKEEIREFVEERFKYSLDLDFDDLVENYSFDVSCQGSVPHAIYMFLISTGFEDAIRNAVAIGGDTDTIAAMAGSIAEAYYGEVPDPIWSDVRSYLPEEFVVTVSEFYSS